MVTHMRFRSTHVCPSLDVNYQYAHTYCGIICGTYECRILQRLVRNDGFDSGEATATARSPNNTAVQQCFIYVLLYKRFHVPVPVHLI